MLKIIYRKVDMAKLYDRINLVLKFYRLYGFGFQLDDSMTALMVDKLLVIVHLSFCIYGYEHVTSMMQDRMPILLDITMVMSVVKVYVYLLIPPTMIVMWQYNRRLLTDLLYKLDKIVPFVESIPLRPYLWHSAMWLFLSIFVEFLIYFTFHIYTNFMYFSIFEYVMIAVYIIWSMLPLIVYVFLIEIISRGVRNVNDQITSINKWRTYRSQWKKLRYMAIHSAENEFGVVIVVFVVYTITEVVYFLFSLYFMGYKRFSTGPVYYSVYSASAFLVVIFRTSWLFQIVRVSQNCKSEVYKLYCIRLNK